jgi:hypothetical protein
VARVDLIHPWFLPQPVTTSNSGNRQIRAIGDYVACIRQAEEAATITKVGFYFDARGTNATPGTCRVGIQSVNTSGDPSGTWLGYTDYTANATNFPNFSGVNLDITANGTASVTRGQLYAIVMYAQSGTWDASNNLQFTTLFAGAGQYITAFPTMKSVVGGAASNNNGAQPHPNIYCESSTATYGNPQVTPVNIASYNSGSTPDEIGVKFTFNASWTTSFNVLGIQGILGITNSAATGTLKLYDSANNLLQSKTFTSTEFVAGNAAVLNRTILFDATTLSDLTPGDTYRITIEATNASLGTTTMLQTAFPNSTVVRAFVGDATYHRTERTNAGSWTDTTDRVPSWKLIISAATASGGGGSAVYNHVGMTGGIRG